MVEYRPFPESREDEFRAFTRYAFSPERGPYDPEEADERESLAAGRGLFDGDEPLAVCGHHEFDLRIRGADRRVAGLSAVACPPEHRRRGLVRRLLRESLAEHRDDGIAVSALWPFEYGFYRRFGWATASRYTHLIAPPEELSFAVEAVDPDAGRFRRLGPDDHGAVAKLLERVAERYDLTMARSAAWWEHRSLRSWQTDPFVYGYERDGALRGLLSYTFSEGEGKNERTMTVSDAVAVDETAWLHLLRFCRNHDSQAGEVRIRAPPDADVLDRVDDPRAVTQAEKTGPMVRLVDVPDALERLPSPEGREGSSAGPVDPFVLAVEDPLVPWNEGRFTVRTDAAGGEVTATDESGAEDAAEDADSLPTVAVDVGTLSQLYVGYLSVGEATRLDRLDPGAARPALERLFPPQPTFLREGF
ncbi:GNAT family N-acetyltransferase [Haloparvum sedimenti]|uniref:GNAT family N-acetyltransferase n=1 Tax=Haloparvum sedimenti TaxID=1678448 RepID=UPI00071E7985|nr:GNAT family N-acetyltransferase [Haloparvum sedimenti]